MSNIPKKEKCLHCPQKFFPHQLREHMFRCKLNKPYECDICGQCFTTASGVSHHKGNYHTAEERLTLYKCRYCGHGSDDKKAMAKHERLHPEVGGPGFRSRSRSRSLGPARSSVGINSATNSVNKRSPRARSCNLSAWKHSTSRSAPQQPTSRPAWQRSISHNRGERSTTNSSTSKPISSINWATTAPTTNNLLGVATESHHCGAESNVQGILPIKIVEDGLLEIAVLNPEYAERKIAEYKRQCTQYANELSQMNQRIRENCIGAGISLNPLDPIERKIQALKEKWPQIYGEPEQQ